MTLVDVNVWLAAAWGRHAEHPVVADWLSAREATMVMCMVTQMSLMTILTMPAILGDDAVTRGARSRPGTTAATTRYSSIDVITLG